ncbi:MAG TPA: hypothetical protein DC047_04190 [Blastocatellia bacterium]|nr:hypothetical protein [Blastocatellia bacterium]
MNQELPIGILAGVVIWSTTSAMTFGLRRRRLRRALIEDLKHRVSNLDDIFSYLEAHFIASVRRGEKLEDYPRYTKDTFPFYEDIRGDLYKYFGTRKCVAIMRCYEALEEIEILMSGLSQDFHDYAKHDKQLTGDDVAFLERKKDRIISVIEVLKRREFRGIGDLPTDYRGMVSAAQIIKK